MKTFSERVYQVVKKIPKGKVLTYLDAYLENDKNSRVAIEVMGGHNLITINGEVTSKSEIDVEKIVKNVYKELENFKIISNIVLQSSEIAKGVDTGGAGDQGIMKGYATKETKEMMPLEYILARNLCEKVFAIYPYDGKIQVTIENEKVKTVVVSFQNTKNDELLKLVKSIIDSEEYLINPAGEWKMGGFDADTGLLPFLSEIIPSIGALKKAKIENTAKSKVMAISGTLKDCI